MNQNLLLVSGCPNSAHLVTLLSANGFIVTLCDGGTANDALRRRAFLAVLLDHGPGGAADLNAHIRSLSSPKPQLIVLDTPRSAGALSPAVASNARRVPCDESEAILAMLRQLPQKTRAGSNPQNDLGGAQCTVLVVDDSLTFRNTLGERLRGQGYSVLLAASGREALEIVARGAVDALVIDLVMPGIDGLETCKRIRLTTNATELPILMLTSDDIRARMLSRGAGANEFLAKLSNFDAVVANVVDFIRRATARKNFPNMTAPAPRPVSGATETNIFAEVVAASGLARVIAEPAIFRACRRAGVDAESMTATDLQRAVPHIERSLRMFLSPADLDAHLETIAAIIARAAKRAEGGQ